MINAKDLPEGWVVSLSISDEEIWIYAENSITDEMLEYSFPETEVSLNEIGKQLTLMVERIKYERT
jgi:hypothetical protein